MNNFLVYQNETIIFLVLFIFFIFLFILVKTNFLQINEKVNNQILKISLGCSFLFSILYGAFNFVQESFCINQILEISQKYPYIEGLCNTTLDKIEEKISSLFKSQKEEIKERNKPLEYFSFFSKKNDFFFIGKKIKVNEKLGTVFFLKDKEWTEVFNINESNKTKDNSILFGTSKILPDTNISIQESITQIENLNCYFLKSPNEELLIFSNPFYSFYLLKNGSKITCFLKDFRLKTSNPEKLEITSNIPSSDIICI